MLTLLLAFANKENNRLPTLTDEYMGVTEALGNRERQDDFRVISRPIATRAQLLADIRRWEEDLCLFLFSGHAGRDRLLLEDGVGHAESLASMLSRCPNLKVVVLNGCSTAGQVDELLSLHVPIIVATSAPVGDASATQFSIALFKELATHQCPVNEAFDRAIDQTKFLGPLPQIDKGEDRSLDTGENITSDTPLWGIYYRSENKQLAITWQLPMKGQAENEAPSPTRKAIRSEVKELVAQNKLREAVDKLRAINEISEEANALSAALSRLEKRERLRIIDSRDARVEWGTITYSLLELAGQTE